MNIITQTILKNTRKQRLYEGKSHLTLIWLICLTNISLNENFKKQD